LKLSLLLPPTLLGFVLLGACSSSSEGNREHGTDPGAPVHKDGGTIVQPKPGETQPNEDGKIESDIVFDAGAVFAPRDCSLTVSFKGTAGRVRIAGEFTSPQWADGAQELTKNGDTWSIKLAPSGTAAPGQLYAYKLILDDSNWILDPANKYRKIVGGQMNSALKLPTCGAGPELRAGKVAVDGAKMSVHVDLLAASDNVAPDRVKASFDGVPIVADNVNIDKAKGGLDFTYDKLAKGKHVLTLRAFDKQQRESDPIDLPFWVEDEPFDYQDGLLYMMMIDRFANGDKSNDAPVAGPVHYDADWHGGDLQGGLKVLQSGYFESLGVRTIWLSPLNEQTSKWQYGDGGQIYSAYHGYWPTFARSVEPRFGGDAALKAFVQEAHKRGIRVLLDLINNQVHEDHEYVKANPTWFRTLCQCGDDANGCGWSVRPFDCYFQPYLPDINWNEAGAEKKFIGDATNWIATYDLDGFRVDAVKHVEANSVFNMRAELSRRFEQGGSRIFMVGEIAVGEYESKTFFGQTFNNGYDWLNAYTGETALDGQFDFPTRNGMADGLVNGDKPLNEVEDQVKKSETNYVPGNRNVRFLNGHDNPRIASIAAKDPKLGCAWSSGCRDDQLPPLAYDDPQVYAKLKRALTVLFTMPGVPYLYMGDEVAFGGGGDPDMRRNMIFDGAGDGLTDLEMAKPGGTPAKLTDKQLDLRAWVQKLGKTRQASHALRRGTRQQLYVSGDLWVYKWSDDRETVIVAINRGAAVSGLAVGGTDGTWKSALGTGALAGGKLTIGAGEAAIFTP
jgi:glycosidase